MSSSLKEHIQVSLAAIFGIGSPGINHVLEVAEPIIQVALTVGQLGVAIVTILYIYRKWKQAAKKIRRPRKSKDETP
jgi:uncharacterized membrane protein YqgA involved in biofilm formation